jgi:hypothetical protein
VQVIELYEGIGDSPWGVWSGGGMQHVLQGAAPDQGKMLWKA